MTIADTPAQPGPPPTGPAPLPIPTPAQVDSALDAVHTVYECATPEQRAAYGESITGALAGEVMRLRTIEELRQVRAALAPARPARAEVERALDYALRTSPLNHHSLHVLAAEVRNLRPLLDGELLRGAAIVTEWRALDVDTREGQRARLAVQAAAGPRLVQLLDELCAHPAWGAS